MPKSQLDKPLRASIRLYLFILPTGFILKLPQSWIKLHSKKMIEQNDRFSNEN